MQNEPARETHVRKNRLIVERNWEGTKNANTLEAYIKFVKLFNYDQEVINGLRNLQQSQGIDITLDVSDELREDLASQLGRIGIFERWDEVVEMNLIASCRRAYGEYAWTGGPP